jgi:hypothetical protein
VLVDVAGEHAELRVFPGGEPDDAHSASLAT